jgi:hypothetical protein
MQSSCTSCKMRVVITVFLQVDVLAKFRSDVESLRTMRSSSVAGRGGKQALWGGPGHLCSGGWGCWGGFPVSMVQLRVGAVFSSENGENEGQPTNSLHVQVQPPVSP